MARQLVSELAKECRDRLDALELTELAAMLLAASAQYTPGEFAAAQPVMKERLMKVGELFNEWELANREILILASMVAYALVYGFHALHPEMLQREGVGNA